MPNYSNKDLDKFIENPAALRGKYVNLRQKLVDIYEHCFQYNEIILNNPSVSILMQLIRIKLISPLFQLDYKEFGEILNEKLYVSLETKIVNTKLCYISSYNNNVYYFINNNILTSRSLSKNEVLKNISKTEHILAFEKAYNIFCKFLEAFTRDDESKTMKYFMYFIANYKVDKKQPTPDSIWGYLPDPYFAFGISEKITFIPSTNHQANYILIDKESKILFNHDMYSVGSCFFNNFLQLKIKEKDKKAFNNMLILISKIVGKRCKNFSKPSYTIHYDIYDLNNYTYKLQFENSTVDITINDRTFVPDNLTEHQHWNPFRPIGILNSKILQTVTDNYNPETLYQYLHSMAFDALDPHQIDNISKMLTMTLMTSHDEHKVVIVTCNSNNISDIKKFFTGIICSEEAHNLSVIDMNIDIKEITHKDFKNNLCQLSCTNTRAIFFDHFDDKLTKGTLTNLIQAQKDTHMQIMVFQTSRDVSYISNDNFIHINLSDWKKREDIHELDNYNALWGRLYLSLYGLHLIFKEKKDKYRFPLAGENLIIEDSVSIIVRDEIVANIANEFIEKCFIDIDEAKKRKKERRKEIAKIKKENPGASNDTIERLINKTPLFSTYDEDFKVYADTYLDTQCPKSVVSAHTITNKDIKKYIMKNYKKTFKHTQINAMYTGHDNKAMGFQYLSLKEPWEITEKQLMETNINKTPDIDEQIQTKLKNLIEVLPKTIDFSKLIATPPPSIRIKRTPASSDEN